MIVINRSAILSSPSVPKPFGARSRTRESPPSKKSPSPNRPRPARKLLTEKLKANPKLVMVFAIDGLSTTAARQVMAELIPDRLFVRQRMPADGNLQRHDQGRRLRRRGRFRPDRLVRKAISTAVSLSQGHDCPPASRSPSKSTIGRELDHTSVAGLLQGESGTNEEKSP